MMHRSAEQVARAARCVGVRPRTAGWWLAVAASLLNTAAQELPPAPPSTPAPLPSALIPPPPPLPPVPIRPPASNRFGVRPLPAVPYRVNPVPTPGRVMEPCPLAFDADLKEARAEPGDTNIVFSFHFTNTAPEQVTVERVHTSCGCTVPQMPAMPWVLAPGTNASFEVALDIRGKRSQLSKMVYLYTSKGFKALTVRGLIPTADGMPAGERLRNLQLAAADRQAVFKGDCARCHAEPGRGKEGRELFQSVCAVCHEAEHRADMVPDLRALQHATGPEHWRTWITHGKTGTLMPAFAESEGGPLSARQIDSLVEYLTGRFPSRPAAAALPSTFPLQ